MKTYLLIFYCLCFSLLIENHSHGSWLTRRLCPSLLTAPTPRDLTQKVQEIMTNAAQVAIKNEHAEITPTHLLIAFLENNGLLDDLLGVLLAGGRENLLRTAVSILSGMPASSYSVTTSDVRPTKDLNYLLKRAFDMAKGSNPDAKVSELELLFALLDDRGEIGEQLRLAGLTRDKIVSALGKLRESGVVAKPGEVESFLAKYFRDITAEAREGRLKTVIGRDADINRVIQVLGRREKANPFLLGETGVGKTAIVEGLAQRIVEKTVPEDMLDFIIYAFDISLFLGGAQNRGELEERFNTMMIEIERRGNIILFIDEAHQLSGAGDAQKHGDLVNRFKTRLARSGIRIIGATTFDEFRETLEKDPAFLRRVQPIMIGEQTDDQILEILNGIAPIYAKHHGVTYSDDILRLILSLSVEYIKDLNHHNPDIVITLLDDVGTRIATKKKLVAQLTKLKDEAQGASNTDKLRELEAKLAEINPGNLPISDVVTASDVYCVMHDQYSIPVEELSKDTDTKLKEIEKLLSKAFPNQPGEVSQIMNVIYSKKHRVDSDRRRPISLLFMGNEINELYEHARLLNRLLNPSNPDERIHTENLARFVSNEDINEFLGSPIITNGKAKSRSGREYDFRFSTVILTTSATPKRLTELAMDLRQVGAAVTFKPFKTEDIERLITAELDIVSTRLQASDLHLSVKFDPSVLEFLKTKLGSNPGGVTQTAVQFLVKKTILNFIMNKKRRDSITDNKITVKYSLQVVGFIIEEE
ncbi:MAG: ATP-dependent Clp protease ATP-binding subunit [Deltaproteobacteria bacterium]|nr:ATP-dependent Clp protease ATP-binding subunit [Deltaproteobacteria bacterium]